MSILTLQPKRAVLDFEKSKQRLTQGVARFTTLGARLRDDKSGSTMIIFGLTMMPVMFFVGMSVDFSRMLTAKSQALAMADAAALAGGRSFQTGATYTLATPPSGSKVTCVPGASLNQNAETAACNYLATTLSQNVVSTVVDFPATASTAEFTVRTTSWVRTPFLGVGEYTGHKSADANAPVGCQTNGWQCQKVVASGSVVAASGGNNDGSNIEVSMMIDITGSMDESDGAGHTKIETVRKAAADAVNILIWDDQTQFTSKVAVVPFAYDVRLPTAAAFTAATGLTSGTGNPCVVEKMGTNMFTDAVPAVGNRATPHGSCDLPASAALVPLTNNKTTLTTMINGLSTHGSTAGQIGTAWAWYALSPNFNSLWDASSAARPYSDLNLLTPKGNKLLKKYAILMTDGEYNTAYWPNGSTAAMTGSNQYLGQNGYSQWQAEQLCASMRTAGIEVYTIGANVSNNSKAFLTRCAGLPGTAGNDASHFYDATDGIKLQAAFRDIALKISSLRINK